MTRHAFPGAGEKHRTTLSDTLVWPHTHKMKILFQGDSVTDCGRPRAIPKDNGEAMGPGYPGLVKARLSCDNPNAGLEFLNFGISGNRVVDLYARWKIHCLNLRPDLVSVLIGVNDSWHEVAFDGPNGVEVPRYTRIYNELLDWTMSVLPNVKFVLIEPFTLGDSENAMKFGGEVRERGAAVKAMAERLGPDRAAFVPMQSFFDEACRRAPWSTWSGDGVHPTPAGHQLIADSWIAAASKFITNP